MKVCIIGASGKLGRYMVQHALLSVSHPELAEKLAERLQSRLQAAQARFPTPSQN